MLADRIEAKWIDAFCEIFERCAVKAGDTAAILSETQSRALNVHLAELALSVLPANRRRGIGSELFRQAVSGARARRIPSVCMHCLSANTPVMRIAHRFGMDLIASDGDAAAYLKLQSLPPAPIGEQTEVEPARSMQSDLVSQWPDISLLRGRQRTQH